ncbi:MAG TPA: MFS transporter [Aliidongia sp.]|uniref:MFS transporter n=1 Tax=Aliidongia sp. TaxID=1914230 RepID=UPI002DDCD625|nr:MFS transporter [Aliidongia sp.]HEV2676471.1 MFS transporter [Aliidongia sp.]
MLIMLLVVFTDLVGFGVVIPLLPFYGEHFGASALTVTMLLATFSGCQLFAAPLWGRLSDRIGRRPIVLISTATSVLAYVWLASADALWMLFAARALQGISAGNISVAQAYVADVTAPENRAKGMGMMGAALGLGFIVGPAIGGQLAGGDPTALTVALPAYAAAAFSALAFILAALLLRESLTDERRAEAIRNRTGRIAQIREAFGRPNLRRLMILFFTTTFAFAGMETTFALWALARFGWGPRQVGELFAMVGIVLVLIQGGLIGKLTRRFGEARMLLAGTVTIGLGLVLLAAAMTPLVGISASCLLALGMGMAQPSTASLISREAGAAEQGGILGVNQSVGSLARLAGPAAAGVAFTFGGPSAPYILGAALMVVSSWLAGRVLRRHRMADLGALAL